jgi:hypothetical protein
MNQQKLTEKILELLQIYETLENCGITGIYDLFHNPVDAIQQMAHYIKTEMSKEEPLTEEEWIACQEQTITWELGENLEYLDES